MLATVALGAVHGAEAIAGHAIATDSIVVRGLQI